nr:hypothetical protein [Tanacetum cinerariifolium]
PLGHRIVAIDYFFNNDMEYLKTSDLEESSTRVEDVNCGIDLRSLIIKKRVEDLQLGVESYQKKLNVTKPQKTFSRIEFKEPYTPSYDPPGAMEKDKQEKDKIGTKPDEKEKRGRARQCKSPVIFLLNYESKPCYIENYNSYPYDSLSFPQQELCCENCEVLPEADHCQTPQYTVNHPILNDHNDLLNANNDLLNSQNKITIAQNKLMEQLTSMCVMIPACYDDDDYSAITPNEPVDSLSMWDEHLNTILATESDEFIKSCVENLVPNLSESEGESEHDMPARVEFTTFSNILFNADYKFDSSDDQSCFDEDVLEKKNLNPLFEEEIIPIKIDQHHDNAESTHDSSLIISSEIDSLLDEFAGELTLLKSILPGIDETGCYPEEDIHFIERLLYDNSSPCPPEEFVFDNSNADIESFSPSPILIKDSDSHMEEIDLTFTPDDPMPPSIEDDDYNFERDILILE